MNRFLEEGYVVIAISESGNSRNVVRAIEYARSKGTITVGLVAYSGGKLINMVYIPFYVQVEDKQIVEDVHMATVHMNRRQVLQ